MKIKKNIAYSKNGVACKLDVYLPEGINFDTIVYFHGGGLESGDKQDQCYIEIAEDFVNHGYGFVSVNYRMYPEIKFPGFLKDAADAVKYVDDHVKKWDGNGSLIIAGQSAGAWISLMLCMNKEYLESVGISSKKIKGWIIDSAQTSSHFNILAKEKCENPLCQRIDETAPLWYVNDNTEFSRMFLIYYEKDMPCRAEQNLLFYRAIISFNPSANIQILKLNGTHCYGSTKKDTDGRYPFVKESIKWLETT